MEEIGVKSDDNRIIEVVNKIDLIDDKRRFNNNINGNMVFISALNGFGLDKLKKKISEKLKV